jgi:hypothetical protein
MTWAYRLAHRFGILEEILHLELQPSGQGPPFRNWAVRSTTRELDESWTRSTRYKRITFGAVVLILKDTGSALGFVILKERFTFWVKGPLKKVSVKREEMESIKGRKDTRLKPSELLG